MKKTISLLAATLLCLSILLPLSLGGCNQTKSGDDSDSGKKKISVVATIFPAYDFARQISGGKADVHMLLQPGSESHSYEPTPQDIIKIKKCDVFIYAGGESDSWVDEILESMDTSKMKKIAMIDCVDAVEEVLAEGMQEEEEEEESGESAEEEVEYDEHVWTSPICAKAIVSAISEALSEADSANADAYASDTTSFLAELDELDAAFKNAVDGSKRKTIVFGDRFPFRYLADAYGLTYYAAFPGCSTETEASAATVKFLIDKINTEKIPAVLHIELSNEKMAQAIAEQTGAKVRQLHACHNISKEDLAAGRTYIELMTENAAVLKEVLN